MNKPTVHMCPRCEIACDCDTGRNTIANNPTINPEEMLDDECDHDCSVEEDDDTEGEDLDD